MQTIIQFLANGGKVHVSFVTFLHFLYSFGPAVATTNERFPVWPDQPRTVKIATEANLRFFYNQRMSKQWWSGHTGKRNLKPKPDRNFSA